MSSKRQDSSYSKALTETSPSETEDRTEWLDKPLDGIKGDKKLWKKDFMWLTAAT